MRGFMKLGFMVSKSFVIVFFMYTDKPCIVTSDEV